MKTTRIILLLGLLLTAVDAHAQLQLKALEKLAAKATETVDISLDGSMLQVAGKYLSGKDADEVQVKKLLEGLKGIYVRSYEFPKAGMYSHADLESVRSQLRGPGWSKIVSTKDEDELAEVYLKVEGGKSTGIAVITAEATELTVVHIAGSVDLNELSKLGGHFGIPPIQIPHK